jgi:FkbM family methyltransferase
MTPSLRPHSFSYRLRESLAILRGRIPARLATVEALTTAQGELAQTRVELGKMAKAVAEMRLTTLEPLTTAQGELSHSMAELSKMANALVEARAEVATLESEVCTKSNLLQQALDHSIELESRLRALADAANYDRSINDYIGFPIPDCIVSAAKSVKFTVIDVGAQNLESSDHVYTRLLDVLSGKVIGFEPLTEELDKRLAEDAAATLLPYAIGTGHSSTLHITRFNPASSLLHPNQERLQQFIALPEMLAVVSEVPVETRRLDDVPGLDDCTLLKVDVQGGELAVLQGATGTLRGIMAVFIEVEFLDLYLGQPLFSAVNSFLDEQGFELLDLMNLGYGSYREANRGDVRSKLLWADGFYVRKLDPSSPPPLASLAQLACTAHYIGNKFDYAAQVLAFCDRVYGTSYQIPYLKSLHHAVHQH